MAFFEFPHTRTYDSDLGWIIQRINNQQTQMDGQALRMDELNTWMAENEPKINEIEELYLAFSEGELPQPIEQALQTWLEESGILSQAEAYTDAAESRLHSEILAEANAREDADDILSSRIDSIIQLPSGSTTGDAELIDARLGINNITYSTAGAAIRAQAQGLKDEIDYTSENILKTAGYSVVSNVYLRPDNKKIVAQSGTSILVVPVQAFRDYIVWKDTSTIMRVGTGVNAAPVAGDDIVNLVYHASASSDPLEVVTGSTDTYLYIQLWAGSDSASLRSIDANILTLTITEPAVRDMQAWQDVVNPNLARFGYTVASGIYIRPDDNRFYAQAGLSVLVFPAEPLRSYKIVKPTSSIMRAATGTESAPVNGTYYTNWTYHTAASADPLYIATGPNDHYLYVQLYAGTDPDGTRNNWYHLPGLVIVRDLQSELDEDINSHYPYTWGSFNQVARLGWSGATPEQSIASYRIAYKMGVRIMLADVRVTADGQFVCWHDADLSRLVRHTDGTTLTEEEKDQKIAEMTLAQLDVYDFGIYKGAEYAGTKILRLQEFMSWCKQTNVWMFLEVKVPLTASQIAQISSWIRYLHMQRTTLIGVQYNHDTAALAGTWAHELPWTKHVVTSAWNDYDAALPIALQYVNRSIETYLGFSNPTYLTDDIRMETSSFNIGLWYSEIQSAADMATFWTDYANDYTIISSSYINIYNWIAENNV